MLLLVGLSIVGLLFAPLRIATLVADAALVALLVLDFLATPSPSRLDIRRSVPARAGLSQEFRRLVRIDVDSAPRAAGRELELREEFPAAFEVLARTVLTNQVPFERAVERAVERAAEGSTDAPRRPGTVAPLEGDPTGGPDAVRLPASGPIDLVRVYRSGRRGQFTVGDMRVRLRGPLGLVQRQARLTGESRVSVEPALAGLRRTLKLAASDRWKDLGVRFIRRRGGLTEFESLRDHVAGDDVRRVDWKAFARRGRPTVRQFQEERGQELILAFDCGRRMGAATEEEVAGSGGHIRGRTSISGWTKLDHALDAGLELAAVALSRGDRVGVIAFDARVLAYVPPARGANQLRRLREAVFALQPSRLESDVARAPRELGLRHRRSALLVMLSDLADPHSVEVQKRALSCGSKRHKIVFAGLDDPSLRLAAEGRIEARHKGEGDVHAAELASEVPTEINARVRAVTYEIVHERRLGLNGLRRPGLRVIDTLPAEAAGPLLGAWLEERRSG